MKMKPMIKRILLAVGYRIVVAVRPQNERMPFADLIAASFLAHVEAAFVDEQKIEHIDILTAGMLLPCTQQGEAASDIVGKGRNCKLNDRHANNLLVQLHSGLNI
ncbi:hypothetical protein D3C77_552300 [compost metagenome]